ncbi:MAG TPA: MFS transporter [Anaerolineales bacterium]|nr:MFS transporter [Anaerolineales bacterium]
MDKNTSILFTSLVIVMMGFGMIIPILPFYIQSFGASGGSMGLVMASYSIMQFLFAPFWGSLSDKYGRKPLLILGMVGNGIAMFFGGVASTLWMLVASRALAGMLSSATLPTAMAFIGDTTSEKDRGAGMGKMGAAMGVGMVLGPGIGGWLAETNLSYPFYLATALSFVGMLAIYLFLPESLPKEKRPQTKIARGPELRPMWDALFSPIGILLFLAFLLSFGMTNFEAVFGIYALARFQYSPKEVGSILTVIGIVSALMQGAMVGPFTKKWGERKIIIASLLGGTLGFLLMLTAFNYLTVLLTVSLFIMSVAMLRPAVASLTSRHAGDIGQGTAMGLNSSFMSLGRIVGPLWAGFLFDVNISFPYMSGAIIMLTGFGVAWKKCKK